MEVDNTSVRLLGIRGLHHWSKRLFTEADMPPPNLRKEDGPLLPLEGEALFPMLVSLRVWLRCHSFIHACIYLCIHSSSHFQAPLGNQR